MLEDLTQKAEDEIIKYVGELYSLERDYLSVECNYEESEFHESLRSSITKVEEVCRYYFGNNYDVAQYLFIAHEFRKKYFNNEETPLGKTKEEKKDTIKNNKFRREYERKFKELMDNE